MRRSGIEVEAIAKRFGSTQALAGVDITAEEGKVLALLGPNGGSRNSRITAGFIALTPMTQWNCDADRSGALASCDGARLHRGLKAMVWASRGVV